MGKPRLLDLFCGAGGAAMGYHRAGFEVVGVDIAPQPNYPFTFWQYDALAFLTDGYLQNRPAADEWVHSFDAIHASPPCQAFSTMRVMGNAREHSDLLTPTRELLKATGLPYVIENVPGSPIDVRPVDLFGDGGGIMLCGSMFGLNDGTVELRRHRWFESTVPLPQLECHHRLPVVGFYGDHARTRQRTIAGHRDRGGDIVGDAKKLPLVRDLMGIDWMTWPEATQAIPPAFTEWIGARLLDELSNGGGDLLVKRDGIGVVGVGVADRLCSEPQETKFSFGERESCHALDPDVPAPVVNPVLVVLPAYEENENAERARD